MSAVFAVLAVQALLGGFDNFWHHELYARLPQRPSARRELALHAAREAVYGVVFLGLAWFEWHGALAVLLGALLVAELGITLADFLEEDRSRKLPPFERVLHTVLAVTYGLFLATLAPHLVVWAARPPASRGRRMAGSRGPSPSARRACSRGACATRSPSATSAASLRPPPRRDVPHDENAG